jgi:hypothetical protein
MDLNANDGTFTTRVSQIGYAVGVTGSATVRFANRSRIPVSASERFASGGATLPQSHCGYTFSPSTRERLLAQQSEGDVNLASRRVQAGSSFHSLSFLSWSLVSEVSAGKDRPWHNETGSPKVAANLPPILKPSCLSLEAGLIAVVVAAGMAGQRSGEVFGSLLNCRRQPLPKLVRRAGPEHATETGLLALDDVASAPNTTTRAHVGGSDRSVRMGGSGGIGAHSEERPRSSPPTGPTDSPSP